MANLLATRRSSLLPTLSEGWDPFPSFGNLLSWDPFQEMSRLDPYRNFRSLLSETGQELLPAMEVKETPTSYVFKVDVPGIKEADIEISLSGNRLNISGKRDAENKEETETYLAYERRFGSFNRVFNLPDEVDENKIKAELKDGVLSITALKLPEARAKKIEVKTT